MWPITGDMLPWQPGGLRLQSFTSMFPRGGVYASIWSDCGSTMERLCVYCGRGMRRPKYRLALALLLVIYGASAAGAAQPSPAATGVVVDGETNQPVPDAAVRTATATVPVGPDGRFTITLALGETTLRVAASGYLDNTVTLDPATLATGAELQILLFRNTFAETVRVTPLVQAPARPSATPIAATEVLEVAGAIDNVFRTLDTLPGVASTGDFGSRLAVRGGTPDQNLTVMDGVEIHNPYRLFGLVSAFNPETVDRFELTTGGFGVAYGDRLSSILVVDNRAGRPAFQGSVAASFTDGNLVVEGAAPAGGSWLVTGRRTYYDLVANLVSDQDFPSFADVQVQVDWEVGSGHRLSVLGLTSRENTDFQLQQDDGRESGRFITTASNDLGSLRLDVLVGERATSRTIVSWYRNTDLLDVTALVESDSRRSNTPDNMQATALASLIFDRALAVRDFSVRQELALQLTPSHALDASVELHRLATSVRQTITGERNESAANPTSVRGGAALPDALDSALSGTRGGVWIQDRYGPSTRFALEPGLRLDWSTVNGAVTLSPRMAATLALGAAGRLRTVWGLYTQSPGYEKLIQSDYLLDLSPAYVSHLKHERATHFVVGYERELGAGALVARVEGYYKAFNDLIVGRLETASERSERLARYDFPAALQASVPVKTTLTAVPVNGGAGKAYGLDVYLARTVLATRLSGWLSYAWGRADRETYGLRYPFEYDRRHAFNVVGRYRLNDRWSVAATAQVATGFPYTPALGLRVAATEDAAGRFVPARDVVGALIYSTDYGGLDNLQRARLPHYARVDLRVTHRPGGADGRWSWYLEVINLLNRDNPVELETTLWHDPDGLRPRLVEMPTGGFPLLPSFGVRVRF